jgi:hypothetical protein
VIRSGNAGHLHAGKWPAVVGAIALAYFQAKGSAETHADAAARDAGRTSYSAARRVDRKLGQLQTRVQKCEFRVGDQFLVGPRARANDA